MLHMTAEEGSRLWHGFAGKGGLCLQEGSGSKPEPYSVEGPDFVSERDIAISRQYMSDDAAQRQSTTSSIPNSSTAISGAAFPVARSTTKTLGARPTVKSV
jgi:hypothetical protein